MGKAKTIFKGEKVIVLERDGWQYVERKKGKSSVAVIAITRDGRIILTEQQRRPVDARVIDWPAGLVGDEDEGEGAEETARRELEEETGFTCSRLKLLTDGPTSPGITSETVRFYRAIRVEPKGTGGGVGGENITVHQVPRAKIRGWLRERAAKGILIDLKIWTGLYFLS